jgi:hypothetical protein
MLLADATAGPGPDSLREERLHLYPTGVPAGSYSKQPFMDRVSSRSFTLPFPGDPRNDLLMAAPVGGVVFLLAGGGSG